MTSKCQLQRGEEVDISIGRAAAGLFDALFPSCCIVCGAAGSSPGFDLCSGCTADLPVLSQACIRCAAALDGALQPEPLCGPCLRKPPPVDVTICAFRYGWPVDHLLRALKYRQAVSHARVLGRLLAGSLVSQRADRPDLLCPVPLGPVRYRTRGFNQALELGRILERILAVPMRADLAERIRDTPEQSALAGAERRDNMRGAFRAVPRACPTHVAIIDDVVTTGSTVGELARVLRDAGAARVDVWAVARTQR